MKYFLITNNARQHPPHRATDARAADEEGGVPGVNAPRHRHVREVGVGDVEGHGGEEVAQHDSEEEEEGWAGGKALSHHERQQPTKSTTFTPVSFSFSLILFILFSRSPVKYLF